MELYGYGVTILMSQLGTNDSISKSTPVTTFAGGNNWKQVSCGGNSSLIAIKTEWNFMGMWFKCRNE